MSCVSAIAIILFRKVESFYLKEIFILILSKRNFSYFSNYDPKKRPKNYSPRVVLRQELYIISEFRMQY